MGKGFQPPVWDWPFRGACAAAGLAAPAAPAALVTACWVALMVAAVATAFPLSVTVTGFVSPKFWQLRLVKDMFSRLARKGTRLGPPAGTGEVPVASRVWLFCRNRLCTLTMFSQ